MLVLHKLVPTFFFILLCAGFVLGQGTSASVSGTVTDQNAAVVPGALVLVKNTETGQERKVQTDNSGSYSVIGLSPGNYELRVERQGFNSEVRNGLKLTVAEEAVLDVQLNVSGVQEAVQVTEAGAAQVETNTSTMSGLVDEKKIRDLPLNGRDMAQLILLQPGVVNSRSSVQSSNTGRGTRFSVAGSRPSQNLFQLDGTTINDALNNTPGSAQGLLVGVETVKEFRVLTNSYSAEYGRATGGVFLAVTKSGTNDLHGSAFEFLRNDNLDARNFFDRTRPQFRRNQYGFTIGGPVMLPFGEGKNVGYNGKNKTFFFGSYEGLREFKGISTVSIVPDNNARLGILPGQVPITVDARSKPIIDLFPRPNGRSFGDGTAEFTGTTNRISKDDFFTVRMDHNFSNSHSIFGRYLYDKSDQVLPRNFPEFPNLAVNTKQVVTLQDRMIISSTIVNEAIFGFNRATPAELVPKTNRSLQLITGRDLGEITVTNLTAVGTDRTNPKLFFLNDYQFTDNLSILKGRHTLKIGGVFERFNYDGNSESRTRGQLRFSSLINLLKFTIQDLQGASADSNFQRNYRQSLFGVFVQDDFRFNKRLTLNLGLRYETVTSPTEANGKVSNLRDILDPAVTLGPPLFNPSHQGFAPRVGFAYDVFGDGKTALRGGFGLFYEQPLFNIFRNPIFRALPFVNRGRLRPCSSSNPPPFCLNVASGNNPLPVDPSLFKGVDQVSETMQFNLRPTYVMQYNLNLQREVLKDTVLLVAYVGSRGLNLLGQGDLNTAIPTILPDGREFFPATGTRRNTKFDTVRTIFQGFTSNYNSVNLGLVRRFTNGLQFQTSYTYGKALDNRSGTSGRQEYSNGQARTFDPYHLNLDRGRADFDVRHSFVANASYDLPFGKGMKGVAGQLASGWQFNTIVTISSGVPFGIFIDGDPDQDKSDDNGARPNLLPGVSLSSGGGSPDGWFNLAAFAPPTVGFRGTAGRNIIEGPNFRTVDLSVVKNFRIDEKRSLQFRAEIFNLFNRANFDLPSNSEDGEQAFSFVTNPAATIPCIAGTRTATSCFTPTGSAGKIFSTVGDAREIQLAVKFIF